MEIKLGEIAYVVVSATDENDIEQAAIDAIIEQHDIDQDNHESISCLFVFEGKPDCIIWEGLKR